MAGRLPPAVRAGCFLPGYWRAPCLEARLTENMGIYRAFDAGVDWPAPSIVVITFGHVQLEAIGWGHLRQDLPERVQSLRAGQPVVVVLPRHANLRTPPGELSGDLLCKLVSTQSKEQTTQPTALPHTH